jgi:hypothetical protein
MENKYRPSNSNFQEFGQMKVDSDLLSKFGLKSINADPETMERLEKELYEIHLESPYYERFRASNEKVKKEETVEIFYYYIERLVQPERYSAMEKFLGVAEFLNMDYKTLYKGIGTPLQSDILRDIDMKTSYTKKNKVKRLF